MILFPRRQVFTRTHVRETRVVLARRARRLREFNDCNLPRGASDGGRFGANDDPRCDDDAPPPIGQIRKTGRITDRQDGESREDWHARLKDLADTRAKMSNPYEREGFDAKKGQQPYDAANYTVTHPGTKDALLDLAAAQTDPDEVAKKQFAYMQEHEPAVVETARELQRYAQAAHEEFVTQLTELSQTLGVDLTYDNVESDAFLDQTNEAIGLGPIKGVDRTSVKAGLEYNGNVLKVKDMLRSTIVVDSVPDMAHALSQLKDVMDVSVKDNVSKPQPGGWRAYNVIARLKKSGMLVEVQITTREMMRGKREGHVYFAQARGMAETHPLYAGLIAKQEAIYNRRWLASGGRTPRARAAISDMAALAATLPPV